MLSSGWLMSVFTVVFLVTGVYSVVRLAALASGLSSAVDRAAELSHVLMSVAMIAMTWDWGGGPSSPSGVLQIVAFGLIGLYFLVGAIRGYRAPLTGAYHLVMALAMVWMVASMPLLMGAGSSSPTAMEGMPWMASGGSGPTGPVGTGAHPWVLPVSIVFVVLLTAAALFWGARSVRGSADQHGCASGDDCAAGGGSTTGRGSNAGDGAGDGNGGVAVVIAAPARVGSLLSPRADAACHALMSAGMAGMLAAML